MDDTSAAFHYDQFFGPLYFEPYAIEVAKRIDPDDISIALEIAAGTGRVTHHLRERIPASAKLIVSDIDEKMLTVAKQKLNGLAVDWQHIAAEQLPFPDNRIDLVVCCFGYMFVHDKTKAFTEAYRVLKPGGQFLITTWDTLESNGASFSYRSVTAKYLETPLPPSADLATSMSDEHAITSLLQDAGFAKTSIEKLGLKLVAPTAEDAASGFVDGDSEIKKGNTNRIGEIKTEVAKEFAEKFGAAPMIAPMSALIAQTWK
jgi:ubiquinone/menaquinone biosynthesis C-methylase UbiE